MRAGRRSARREEGSALIIALIFVTVVGLIVAAVLSFADVGLKASKAYTKRAKSSFAADAAIAAATKRYSTTGPCDDFTAPLVEGGAGPGADTQVNGQGIIVRCQGPPPAAARRTQPIHSLLSLGDGGSDGIESSQELRLLGDLHSNTTVSTTATMVVQGEVSAVGACTGPIQTAPPGPLRCANATPPAPASPRPDPRYTAATTVVPERRLAPLPSCGGSWLVALEPGYYDDAAALSALTGPTSCNDKVVWFKPGTYYFDLGFGGGPGTWSVENPSVVVVAGEPKGWTPDPSRPRPSLNVPGSCKKDGDPGAFSGVQLIAGGATRLSVVKGRMELCAAPSTVDQQIALFGVQEPPGGDVRTLEATDITGEGFTSALNAQSVDEVPVVAATATLTTAAPSASLGFASFRPGVPLGSVIDAVSLRVDHQEVGGMVALTVAADFPGSSCPLALPKPLPANGRLDLVVACGPVKAADFAALTVTFAAALSPGPDSAVSVDGVVIEVAYRTPVTRKPTTVLGTPGYANAPDAREIGEQPTVRLADANLSSTTTSASITLAGMGDPLLAPLATIDSAVLRVAHQEQGDIGAPTVSASAGSCTNLALTLRPDGVGDDRVDLKACGLDTPARLKGLTVTYTAALAPGGLAGVSRLDGIWLEVVSTDPAGPPPPPTPSTRQASTATATGFSTPTNALAIGEVPTPLSADAALSGATVNAGLTVANFNRIPLPPGSTVSSAQLRVAHQEDANVGSVGVTATVPAVPGYPGGTCTPPLLPSPVGMLTTTVVDLAPCGLASPDQFTGLAATYTATRSTVARPGNQVPATATAVDFADTGQAGRAIDGVTTAAKLQGNTKTASVTLSGYDQAPPPPGSTLDTATLRIAHQDDGDIAAVNVTITASGLTTCAAPLPVRNGAITVDTVNLQACGLTDPAQLAGLKVVYAADRDPAPGKKADDLLDGVELALTYRLPAVDKLDGIELDVVFQAPAIRPLCVDCDLLTVAPPVGDKATRFATGGTIYAPKQGVDISMYGLKDQVFSRGVIARSIRLGLQTDGYKRPTGAIPPEVVTFTAYPDKTLIAGTATASPPSGFTNAAAAEALDGVSAVATLNDGNPASLDLGAFGPSDLSASAPIDFAALRISHQDDGNTIELTVRVGGVTCVTQVLAPSPTKVSLTEDQIDLTACRIDRAAKLATVSVTYTVVKELAVPAPAVARVDSITLEGLSGPMVRARLTFNRAKATIQEWSVLP